MTAVRSLDGVRVLELGQLVAGPFAGTLLSAHGADVVKVEPMGGDPIRSWREQRDGTSFWWRSLSRNKRCIAVDLRVPEGQAIVLAIAKSVDVVIENFRPGRLERWGIGPEVMRQENPDLVVVRVSGYGQTGPLKSQPGYASVCEAFGGLRHLTGEPGEPPVRANLSLGDSLAGVHAAFGAMVALFRRDQNRRAQDGGDQPKMQNLDSSDGASANASAHALDVDCAIYESVFNMLESVSADFAGVGHSRAASGQAITGVVPTGAYLCADGKRVVIGANGEALFRRLCGAIERDDLAQDVRLSSNPGRVQHQKLIDEAIGTYTAQHPCEAVIANLRAVDVPVGPIYDAGAIADDPHYAARRRLINVTVDGEPVTLPATAPVIGPEPERLDWAGPALGAHTNEVLAEILSYDSQTIEDLRARGVVG